MFVQHPRLSKKEVQLEMLKLAAPELFEVYLVASGATWSWKDLNALNYQDVAALLRDAKINACDSIGAVPFMRLAQAHTTVMWAHDGRCSVGEDPFCLGGVPSVFTRRSSKMPFVRLYQNVAEEEAARAERSWSPTEELTAGGREPPLPSILPMPVVRHGKTSEQVLFLSPEDVLNLLEDGNSPFGGRTRGLDDCDPLFQVHRWRKGTTFKIPSANDWFQKRNKSSFRMLASVSPSDRVVQLQQCCAIQFEETESISPHHWAMPSSRLVGHWELPQWLNISSRSSTLAF